MTSRRGIRYSMSDYSKDTINLFYKTTALQDILKACSEATETVVQILQNAGYNARQKTLVETGKPHWYFTIDTKNIEIKKISCSTTVDYYFHSSLEDIVTKPSIKMTIQMNNGSRINEQFVNVYDMITFLNKHVGM